VAAGMVWPADRAWELGIRWFSADGGAKQGVCRGYSGFLFMDHHRPANKYKKLALHALQTCS